MVHITSTSLAVLLGSAALSSAAALPARREQGHSGMLQGKRTWRGRHGARGPLRTGDEHYLINVDLTGDGAHHNGHGDLIDINTRNILDVPTDVLAADKQDQDLLKWHVDAHKKRDLHFTTEEEEIIRAELQAHMKRNEPLITLGPGESVTHGDPLVDVEVLANLRARDDRLLDLAAKIFVGASRQRRDEVDLSHLEAAAKAVGVSDEQIADAKNAVDSLSPLQKLEVENAVRHAMWASTKPGEKRDVVARSEEDDMGGAPGYIDITSPMFNSTGQKIASLVLATNGTSENSTFVLNASSSVRTKVYMVPINATETGAPEPVHKEGEPIKVNLKVPVFVADTASVEPFCATFDPSPDAPEPMTVEPCEEPEDERSQVFLYDPETGSVKPNWTPTDENKKMLEKVPDTVTSEMPTSTSSASSSAVSTSTSSASSSIESSIAPQSASASESSSSSVEPSATSSVVDPISTTASSESAEPTSSASASVSESSSSAEALATPSVSEVPSAAPTSIVASVSSEIPSPSVSADPTSSIPELPVSSASPTDAVPSAPVVSEIPSAPVSSAPSVPSPSAPSTPVSVPSPVISAPAEAAANNIDLIFTPSHASVMSVDDDEDETSIKSFMDNTAVAEHLAARAAEDDCDDAVLLAAPSAAPVPSSVAKPKVKAGAKLPEGQTHDDAGNKKLTMGNGSFEVENIKALNGRLGARYLRRQTRQQKTFSATQDATAPYM